MTILQYLGYGFSAIFLVSSVVFFIISMYVGLKYAKNILQTTQKSIELSVRYSLMAIFTFGLGSWLFLIVENGFSWEPLVLLMGGMLFASVIVLLSGYIRRS